MRLSDITVEVRNKNLARLGQIRPEDLDLSVEEVFNNVGTWTLKLPPEHHLADELRTPGAGIVVTGPTDVLFSGPVTNPAFESSPSNPDGMVTFDGVTDDVILHDHLSIPQPSNPDMTTQNVAHDNRTGTCEGLLHAYVNANIGPSAPSQRRKSGLTMGTNLNRGPVIKKSPRFPVLGVLLAEIAVLGGLGFRVVQRGSNLVFETYAIRDQTATVRLDIRNRQLTSQKVTISPPGVTRVLVAGQDEGVNRQFVYRDNPTSLAAEAEWGRRIERFVDQRQTDDIDELRGAADKLLKEEGYTAVAAQATPAEDSAMRFGHEWYLGDRVKVTVDDQELEATVVGMVMKADASGFRVGAKVGDPTKFDREATHVRRVTQIDQRVSQIEQNVEPKDLSAWMTSTTSTLGSLQTQVDSKLSKSGGTMTGAISLPGAPASALHASTKQYVDDQVATRATAGHNHDAAYVNVAGDNMGGKLQIDTPQGITLHSPGAAVASIGSFNYEGYYALRFTQGWTGDSGALAPIQIGTPVDANSAATVEWIRAYMAPVGHGNHYAAAGTSVVTTDAAGNAVIYPGVAFSVPIVVNGDYPAHPRSPHVHSWTNSWHFWVTNCNPNSVLRLNWIVL